MPCDLFSCGPLCERWLNAPSAPFVLTAVRRDAATLAWLEIANIQAAAMQVAGGRALCVKNVQSRRLKERSVRAKTPTKQAGEFVREDPQGSLRRIRSKVSATAHSDWPVQGQARGHRSFVRINAGTG